jgi:hypothetical protein
MTMNEGEVILFGDGGWEINDDFPGIFIASVCQSPCLFCGQIVCNLCYEQACETVGLVHSIAGGNSTEEVTTCTSFGVCILFRCVKSTQYPPGFTGFLTVADEARF